MKKLKRGWHRHWARWHYSEYILCFKQYDQFSASVHTEKHLYHAGRYVELGGDPKYVYKMYM